MRRQDARFGRGWEKGRNLGTHETCAHSSLDLSPCPHPPIWRVHGSSFCPSRWSCLVTVAVRATPRCAVDLLSAQAGNMPVFLCSKVDVNYLIKTGHEAGISVYWNDPLNPFPVLSAIGACTQMCRPRGDIFVLMSARRSREAAASVICGEPLPASLRRDVILSNSGGSLLPTAFVRNNNNIHGFLTLPSHKKNRKYRGLAKGISVSYRNKSQYFYEEEGNGTYLY